MLISPRGITLLDLVTIIPQSLHSAIPDDLAAFLEQLSVVESSTRASGDYDIVEGTARAALELLGLDVGDGFTAEIPGVTEGLRFTYVMNRSPIDTTLPVPQNVEPLPSSWQLSLYADRLLVPIPGIAALREPTPEDGASSGFVGRLVADPDRQRVHVWVDGVVVISNEDGPITARIASDPDPFAPDLPSGAILRAGIEPRHMLFDSSGFGMTMGEVVWDQSTVSTPPEIAVRGHGPSWRGLSISDATLYLPPDLPFVGDVTAGVRDLLIGFGQNSGVQLEAFLQFGGISRLDADENDPDIDKVELFFYQDIEGAVTEISTTNSNPLQFTPREVPLQPTTPNDMTKMGPARVMARLYPPNAEAKFRLPGTTTWITANDTGWLTVHPGDPKDILGYRDIVPVEGGEADGPEITFAFVPPSEIPPQFAPKIQAGTDPFVWDDVTHISANYEQIEGLWFEALGLAADDPDVERLIWELRYDDAVVDHGTGLRFTPTVPYREGGHFELVLTDHDGRTRRLQLDILEAAERMVIGCAQISSPYEAPGPRLLVEEVDEPAIAIGVVGSYRLRTFNDEGSPYEEDPFVPSDDPAVINPSEGTVTIPDGTLAEITLAGGAVSHAVAAFRVLFENNTTTPLLYRHIYPANYPVTEEGQPERLEVDPWGPADPYPNWDDPTSRDGSQSISDITFGPPPGSDPEESLAYVIREWANSLLDLDPATEFVVIGRSDYTLHIEHRTSMGSGRAERGRAWLEDESLGPNAIRAPIYSRAENEATGSGTMPTDNSGLPSNRDLAARSQVGFRIDRFYADKFQDPDWIDNLEEPERQEARCVDIYAVAPSPLLLDGPDGWNMTASTLRRTFVAGADQWEPITEPPRERDLGFAMRMLAKWDSPSWVDAQDSLPTLVEVGFDWQNKTLEVPNIGPVQAEPTDGQSPDDKIWQVIIRFTNDPRTKQMTISGALDSPGSDTGLLQIVDRNDEGGPESDLALMLGFGPALSSAVTPDGPAGSLVSLAALGAVYAASSIFEVASAGEVTLHRLEIGYGRGAGGEVATAANRIWLYADYSSKFNVAVGTLVTGTGIELRYRRAGVEMGIDNTLDSLDLVFEEPAEIVTPGTWAIDNALAKLLGVEEIRVGAGSVWFEVDLAPAISLGPVVLEQATLRLTIGDETIFELRGLELSIDIPGVLQGSGRLAITETSDGKAEVSAALALAIEPIGLGIDASFRYVDPMAQLDIGITFATAIPILGTGLGLFGLAGRFVSNGTRSLPSADDPVQRELDWLAKDNLDKYEPLRGQTAIGIGATVGTQPDAGFTFNLTGMLVIEVPDPSVVLTVEASFVSPPVEAAEEAQTSGALLGIIAINGDGIAIGIRGQYLIPSLLDVRVPVAAWFPFTGDGPDAYVRVGSDGFGGRAGDPVTVTILPGTLDLQAWSYLMIEEKEMLDLGGKGEDWDFTGFSIGFGAGYDFEWGGSAVYLRAGSSIVVGLGTKPLFIKGELIVGGELRFGPVGVSIDGFVNLTLTKDDARLEGSFCGEVDLALFKAKGCVEITIGEADDPPIIPDPLVSDVTLTDRHARIVARATDGATPGDQHTAWIDSRPTLHFSRGVINGLEADSFQPTPSGGWGAEWGGSNDTKFLHRLRSVRLFDEDKNPVADDLSTLPSTWWMPAGRPAFPTEGDAPASEHDAWDLVLLAFDLAPWARSLTDGGESGDSDPAVAIERLCDPLPQVTPHCVFGADGVRVEPGLVKFGAIPSGSLPWRSAASLVGRQTLGPSLDAELTWAGLLGYRYSPGGPMVLPETWVNPSSATEVDEAWQLPGYTHDTLTPLTVGLDGTYTTEVDDPDLVIALSLPGFPNDSEEEVCFTFEEVPVSAGGQIIYEDPKNPILDFGLVSMIGAYAVNNQDGHLYAAFNSPLNVEIGATYGNATFGPATRVEADVMYWGTEPIHMTGFDSDGAVVALAGPPADHAPEVQYTLAMDHPRLARVELTADESKLDQILYVGRLCFQLLVNVDQDAYLDSLVETFEEAGTLLAPRCVGLRPSDEREWTATMLDIIAGDDRVFAFVRYEPDPADDGPWHGLQLSPIPWIDVAIVSSCFTTTEAVEAAEAASDAQQEVVDTWNATWNGEEDRVVLLTKDRTWTVEVAYDLATWTRSGVAGPPSVTSLDWDDPPDEVTIVAATQSFEFKTAPELEMAEADLLRFDVQDAFDPRALARYVIGFDPEHTAPRHFLEDKLLVHFEVDWIEDLLAEYDYKLALDVLRTDPLPGEGIGFGERLVASTVVFDSKTATMQGPTSDARMAVAALLGDCLDGPQPQGMSACVTAEDLVPLAEYDLVVRAVPNVVVDEAIVIARSHFSTSAYRNADELLAALGFDATPNAKPDPVYPLEELLTAAPPTDVVLADDVALDETLAMIGLDPLPSPEEPTTRLLWLFDGSWKVAGLLLDSLEPLERPPRLEDIFDNSPPTDAGITLEAVNAGTILVALTANANEESDEKVIVDYIEAPARLALTGAEVGMADGVALTPRRSNASATRILLTADAPFVPVADDPFLQLTWTDRIKSRLGTRYVPPIPHLVRQEQP